MSIWTRITEALGALAAGEPLSAVFAKLRTPPERTVAFAIAVIALGAKMAKADGAVTRNEVSAFRQIFVIPPSEEAAAARVFNLARQDVAGFDAYARQIARMFGIGHPTLADLLESLFFIAVADGDYHDAEDGFLREVSDIFGIDAATFRGLRLRFVPHARLDSYEILGVSADASIEAVRAAWRRLVRETHPDAMIARGLPEEAIKMATARLAAINAAWEDICGGDC